MLPVKLSCVDGIVRRSRRPWRLGGVVVLVAALGACGDGAERPAERPPPSAAPAPAAPETSAAGEPAVRLSDFGANALVRFDPASERFDSFPLPTADGRVRQLLGRPGELWGAESAVDKLVVARSSS